MEKNAYSCSPDELRGMAKTGFALFETKEPLYESFAGQILDEIERGNAEGRPTPLILPVGPKGQYPIFIREVNRRRISLKNLHAFMMDEYLDWQGRPLPPGHPLSFCGYIEGVFAEIDAELRPPTEQIYFPDPCEIDRYSERLAALGGPDACFGGIGSHGHVAFNEPPNHRLLRVSDEEFAASLTRIVPLNAETIVLNSIRANGGNYGDFPVMAVTVGMADIFSSKKIRLFCDGGAWQRFVLRTALFGEPSCDYPVTLLQKHPDIVIHADRSTAQPPESQLP